MMLHRLIATATGLLALFGPLAAAAQTAQSIATNGVYQVQRSHSSGFFDSTAGSAGKTFVTWSGAQMDVWVRAYDHATSQWEPAVRVRNNAYTHANAYHNYPAMVRNFQGRLVIFYFDHDVGLFQLTAPTAGSVSGTWTYRDITPAGERPGYPTPIVSGQNIYLFYRDTIGGIYRPLKYIKSTDNGATWGAPRMAIDTGDVQADNLDEVYPDDIGIEPSQNRIRIAWHLAGGPQHNAQTKNVYFTYMSTVTDTFYTVSNANLGTTIDSADFANEATNRMRVFQALPSTSVPQPIPGRLPTQPISNLSARPLVGFNYDNGSGIAPWSAIWDGTNWVARRMQSGGVNVPGILQDFQSTGTSTVRAVLVNRTTNEIYVRQSSDAGASWSNVWTYAAGGQLINGADRLTLINTISQSTGPIDFLVTTHRNSTRDTDYSGQWNVFILRD